MQNIVQTEQSQYANSPVLDALINGNNAYFDPSAMAQMLYDDIWNVATAQGYGLDVWGRIVGVGRTLQVSPKWFGFEEAGNISADPFGQSPFYPGSQTTNNFALSDAAYRVLIYAKAAANIWDGSTPGLNKILLMLFPGRGNAYAANTGPLAITYTFFFQLTPVETAVLLQSGVLPAPAGVSVAYVEY